MQLQQQQGERPPPARVDQHMCTPGFFCWMDRSYFECTISLQPQTHK